MIEFVLGMVAGAGLVFVAMFLAALSSPDIGR